MHMYHEIASPYEFLWRLRPSLVKGGQIVIIDVDKPTGAHGIPPALLKCEVEALGYQEIALNPMPQQGVYMAVFALAGERPEPGQIKVCKA
jgi:hypothetical protein